MKININQTKLIYFTFETDEINPYPGLKTKLQFFYF